MLHKAYLPEVRVSVSFDLSFDDLDSNPADLTPLENLSKEFVNCGMEAIPSYVSMQEDVLEASEQCGVTSWEPVIRSFNPNALSCLDIGSSDLIWF